MAPEKQASFGDTRVDSQPGIEKEMEVHYIKRMPRFTGKQKILETQSEDFYDLIEHTPLCIKVFDAKGNLLFLNKGGREEHFLKDTDDVNGWDWLGTVKKEYQAKVKKIFASVLKGGTGEIEFEHTPEGSRHQWCRGILSPLKDKDGKIKLILFYSVDITKSKIAEFEADEDNKMFHTLLDSVLLCIKWFDSSGSLISINKYGRDEHFLDGKTEEEIRKWNYFDCIEEKYHEKIKNAIKMALKGEEGGFEMRHIPGASRGEWCMSNFEPVRNGKNEVKYVLFISRDITEEKKNKDEMEAHIKKIRDSQKTLLNAMEDVKLEKEKSEALVRELNKFQLAVDNSYEHVIFTDPEGVIIYANKAAERITGYSRGEMIGNRPSLWGNQMSREFYEEMWHTIKVEKEIFHAEIVHKRKNSQLYTADLNIFPIIKKGKDSRNYNADVYIIPVADKDSEIQFFVGIERDITEEKKLENARINFVSIASHQLRTPITSIKWIAELLISGDTGKLNEKQADFLSDLYSSTERMIVLINSLLNIARIESQELAVNSEIVSMDQVYEGAVKEFEPKMAAKKIKFSFADETGLPGIATDPHLFYEVLKNMLSNSVKYTPEGGSIEVRFTVKGDDFVCSVEDTGIGIPKHQQDRVFDKFFRADNAVKTNTDGTGLGMYIMKNLVLLLGGRIWFESEENKGTAVHAALPLAGPHTHAGQKDIIDSERVE